MSAYICQSFRHVSKHRMVSDVRSRNCLFIAQIVAEHYSISCAYVF